LRLFFVVVVVVVLKRDERRPPRKEDHQRKEEREEVSQSLSHHRRNRKYYITQVEIEKYHPLLTDRQRKLRLSAKAYFVLSKDLLLLLLLKTRQRSHQRGGKEKEFGEEEHAKRTRAEDIMTFVKERAFFRVFGGYAWYYASFIFRRQTTGKRSKRARVLMMIFLRCDEKDSPNEFSVFALPEREFEREFERESSRL